VNVRSAFLHVVGDVASSAIVVAGALLIHLTASPIIDPILGIIVSLLLFAGAYGVIRESVGILMEKPAGEFDLEKLRVALVGVPGVNGVHDLHVWRLCSNVSALSAHVEVPETRPVAELLRSLAFAAATAVPGYIHPTFQIEPADCDAPPCGAPLRP